MIRKLAAIALFFALFTINTGNADAAFFGFSFGEKNVFSFTEKVKSVLDLDLEKEDEEASSEDPIDLGNISNLIKTYEVVATYDVVATAYSSEPWQTDDTPFITASNTHVRDGIIAANFLPFGTLVRIPDIYGDKIFVVEDRMNARYWYNIDVWFADTQLAREFGRKSVTIEVL